MIQALVMFIKFQTKFWVCKVETICRQRIKSILKNFLNIEAFQEISLLDVIYNFFIFIRFPFQLNMSIFLSRQIFWVLRLEEKPFILKNPIFFNTWINVISFKWIKQVCLYEISIWVFDPNHNIIKINCINFKH